MLAERGGNLLARIGRFLESAPPSPKLADKTHVTSFLSESKALVAKATATA